jgi:hypothetical protein
MSAKVARITMSPLVQMRGGTVHTDCPAAARTFQSVGHQTRALRGIPDVDRFVGQDAGGIEQVLVDGHAAFVRHVGVSDGTAMDLRLEDVEAHGFFRVPPWRPAGAPVHLVNPLNISHRKRRSTSWISSHFQGRSARAHLSDIGAALPLLFARNLADPSQGRTRRGQESTMQTTKSQAELHDVLRALLRESLRLQLMGANQPRLSQAQGYVDASFTRSWKRAFPITGACSHRPRSAQRVDRSRDGAGRRRVQTLAA